MSEEEVSEALESLVVKGLAKKRLVDGHVEYGVTELGMRVLKQVRSA